MDVMAHTTVDSGFGSRRQQLPEVSQRQFRLPAYSVDLTATAVLVPASGHAPELAAQGPAAPGAALGAAPVGAWVSGARRGVSGQQGLAARGAVGARCRAGCLRSWW